MLNMPWALPSSTSCWARRHGRARIGHAIFISSQIRRTMSATGPATALPSL